MRKLAAVAVAAVARAMEVEVLSVHGAAETAVVSVRAGHSRRQAVVSTIGKQGCTPFKFNAGLKGVNPFRIDLLQPVASARLAINSGSAIYTAELKGAGAVGGGSVLVNFSVRDENDGALENPPAALADEVAAESSGSKRTKPLQLQDADMPQFQAAAAATKEYLDSHRLLEFIRALLQTVVRDKPSDPFGFISEQFLNASNAASGTAPASGEAGTTPMSPPAADEDAEASPLKSAPPPPPPPRDEEADYPQDKSAPPPPAETEPTSESIALTAELEESQRRIQQLQEEIEALREQVASQPAAVPEKEQEETVRLERKNSALQVELEEMKTHSQELVDEVRSLKEEIGRLVAVSPTAVSAKQREEKLQLEQQNLALQAELDQSRQQSQQLAEQVETLKIEIATMAQVAHRFLHGPTEGAPQPQEPSRPHWRDQLLRLEADLKAEHDAHETAERKRPAEGAVSSPSAVTKKESRFYAEAIRSIAIASADGTLAAIMEKRAAAASEARQQDSDLDSNCSSSSASSESCVGIEEAKSEEKKQKQIVKAAKKKACDALLRSLFPDAGSDEMETVKAKAQAALESAFAAHDEEEDGDTHESEFMRGAKQGCEAALQIMSDFGVSRDDVERIRAEALEAVRRINQEGEPGDDELEEVKERARTALVSTLCGQTVALQEHGETQLDVTKERARQALIENVMGATDSELEDVKSKAQEALEQVMELEDAKENARAAVESLLVEGSDAQPSEDANGQQMEEVKEAARAAIEDALLAGESDAAHQEDATGQQMEEVKEAARAAIEDALLAGESDAANPEDADGQDMEEVKENARAAIEDALLASGSDAAHPEDSTAAAEEGEAEALEEVKQTARAAIEDALLAGDSDAQHAEEPEAQRLEEVKENARAAIEDALLAGESDAAHSEDPVAETQAHSHALEEVRQTARAAIEDAMLVDSAEDSSEEPRAEAEEEPLALEDVKENARAAIEDALLAEEASASQSEDVKAVPPPAAEESPDMESLRENARAAVEDALLVEGAEAAPSEEPDEQAMGLEDVKENAREAIESVLLQGESHGPALEEPDEQAMGLEDVKENAREAIESVLLQGESHGPALEESVATDAEVEEARVKAMGSLLSFYGQESPTMQKGQFDALLSGKEEEKEELSAEEMHEAKAKAIEALHTVLSEPEKSTPGHPSDADAPQPDHDAAEESAQEVHADKMKRPDKPSLDEAALAQPAIAVDSAAASELEVAHKVKETMQASHNLLTHANDSLHKEIAELSQSLAQLESERDKLKGATSSAGSA